MTGEISDRELARFVRIAHAHAEGMRSERATSSEFSVRPQCLTTSRAKGLR